MKRASCICGTDLTDGTKMMKHLVANPSHRQLLVQIDGKLYMNYVTGVYPDRMEIDVEAQPVHIKKVRSGA